MECLTDSTDPNATTTHKRDTLNIYREVEVKGDKIIIVYNSEAEWRKRMKEKLRRL